MSKKAVVFSADLSYMEKLETAMKSLCAYQDQLKIYVLNEDSTNRVVYYHESALAPVGFRSDQLSDVS